MQKLITLNLILSFLYSGCSGVPVPALPQHQSFSAPISLLFPQIKKEPIKITTSYDTRNWDDATVKQLNTVLRGDLKGAGKLFRKYAKIHNVSVTFAAAVSIAESGGKSRVSNYFGLMKNGRLRSFKNKEECISFFFERIHTYYHGERKCTIKEIQRKYCPVGGEWLRNVASIANRIQSADINRQQKPKQ